MKLMCWLQLGIVDSLPRSLEREMSMAPSSTQKKAHGQDSKFFAISFHAEYAQDAHYSDFALEGFRAC